MKKTYFTFDHEGMTTMRGRSRQATALGFHNSPERAVTAHLSGLNRDGVRDLAKQHEIPGRGGMTKAEMVGALVKRFVGVA